MNFTRLAVGALLTAAMASSLFAQGSAPYTERPGHWEFTGEMILKPAGLDARGIEDQDGVQRAVALIAEFELVEHQVELGHWVVKVPAGTTENQVAEALLATGLFEIAEPNWRLFPLGCPNDSRFGSQWHHDNSHLDSCLGWDLHTGNPSTTVAICDTGIRTTHEDFQLHRQEGYNAVDRLWESNGGNIGPVHPHGTNTTGCAAANGNNGVGIAGIGWNLGHRMMRVSNSSGGGASLSDLTHAAVTAVQAGDKVSSVSYSGVNNGSVRSTATTIKNLGGLLVWAAGNDGANLNWGDRDADDLIVTGATDSGDNKASWSAYGRSVDLVAPGVSVYTTDSGNDSDYASVSGTSFSCPLTAGLCALIFSADPSLSPDAVETYLKDGCDDLGSSGIDDTYGYGRINVNNSMVLADNGGSVALPTNGFLFSIRHDGTVSGIPTDDADILAHDTDSNNTYMYVDFSDVNSGNADIDAFCMLADGTFLVSFIATENIDGLTGGPSGTTVDDEDLVRFTPSQTGTDTAGTWSFYFDGSDVGLTPKQLDIDAVSFDASTGNLHFSFQGPWDLGGGFTGKDEDILEFVPTSLGSVTAGSFSMLLDASDRDIKLGTKPEDIDAYTYTATGDMVLSTVGDFRVPTNLTGQDNDLLIFFPSALGNDPDGLFQFLFDGATIEATMDIDGLHFIQ